MFLADMATKNLPKISTHIKTTETSTWIRRDDDVEIYAWSTSQEVATEVLP